MLNPEDILGLPKVRKGTKTCFGVLCKRHPEHYGFRYANTCECVACQQAKHRKQVEFTHPDGRKEWMTRGLAAHLTQVEFTHPDGRKEWMTRSLAVSKEQVEFVHPDGRKEWMTRNLAAHLTQVEFVHPDGRKEWMTRGLATSKEQVEFTHPDGRKEWMTRGLAVSKEQVEFTHLDGRKEWMTRGLAASKILLSTPEGRARNAAKNYAYQARLDENTRALNLSPEEVELTNEVVKEIQLAGFTVDHMEPANKGGAHVYWNLNGLTGSTNSSKSDRELDLSATPHWLEMLEQGYAEDYYERLVLKLLGRQQEPE